MNDLHIWGWEIALYLFLCGLSAGVMILAGTIRSARRLVFIAPVALSIGMFALFLDLESKLHVFRFYTAFRVTSPMSWGAWILLAIYPATILYGFGRYEDVLRKVNVGLGIALGAYTGVLLGTLTARAAWGSFQSTAGLPEYSLSAVYRRESAFLASSRFCSE